MDGNNGLKCNAAKLLEVSVIPGSAHPAAFRRGVRVALKIEEDSGIVIATSGGGAVRLGYLTGPDVAAVARCLRSGHPLSARIVETTTGPNGKRLRIRLDQPCP